MSVVVVAVTAFAASQWVAVQVDVRRDDVGGDAAVAAISDDVLATWAELDAASTTAAAPSLAASTTAPPTLTLRTSTTLPPHLLARSTPGRIELRPQTLRALDERGVLALRHEVVHQWLWQRCPQSSRDRLFHEALAVAFSGEVEAWRRQGYLTTPQAVQVLKRADLDTPAARQALARLVSEGEGVSSALRRGLSRCADEAPWVDLDVRDLADDDHVVGDDALVVMSTATGEILEMSGAARSLMPVGSTLKPFIVHAALADGVALPTLSPRANEPLWACGGDLRVGPKEALLQSCNGWFLDVEAALMANGRGPLGAFGPAFVARGMRALPTDMSEAIGVRSALRVSPVAMAELWRVLMLSSSTSRGPAGLDVREVLKARGTLDGAEAIDVLAGMSAKTGTVRDSASRPILGVLVASDDELVVVRTRRGVAGRGASADVAAAVRRHRHRQLQPVAVQVFGLVPADDVVARCAGTLMTVTSVPTLVPDANRGTSLRALTRGQSPSSPSSPSSRSSSSSSSTAVCVGGPMMVTPTSGRDERAYAGTFIFAPPAAVAVVDDSATARQRAARRGSDFVFRTSRGAYAAGVVRAEDAAIRGEARVALLKVVDHNVDAGGARHPGRPVCDTTHCQTFLGSVAVDDVAKAALGSAYVAGDARRWLPFSQGGDVAWQESRPAPQLRAAVGAFVSVHVKDGAVVVVRQRVGRDGPYDDAEPFDCERLRSRLRLPSCPSAVRIDGDDVIFEGKGAGHGLGLDVEAAKKAAAAGQSAQQLLDGAYATSK